MHVRRGLIFETPFGLEPKQESLEPKKIPRVRVPRVNWTKVYLVFVYSLQNKVKKY